MGFNYALTQNFIYEFYCVASTLLLGVAVVIGREGMINISLPHTFNMLQQIVGLILLLMARQYLQGPTDSKISGPTLFHSLRNTDTLRLGVLCAIPCFLASSFNQIGLVSVDAGKSAFMTSLYVVLTPLIQYVAGLSKGELTIYTWGSALLSIAGSYFLADCFEVDLSVGEMWTLLGALMYSVEILVTDHSVSKIDTVDLTCMQLAISSLMCVVSTYTFEYDGLQQLAQASFSADGLYIWGLIIIGGILEAVAYVLVNTALTHVDSSRIAVLMALDVVVTAVLAYMYLGEILSTSELIGCGLLLASTMIVSYVDADADEVESKVVERTESDVATVVAAVCASDITSCSADISWEGVPQVPLQTLGEISVGMISAAALVGAGAESCAMTAPYIQIVN